MATRKSRVSPPSGSTHQENRQFCLRLEGSQLQLPGCLWSAGVLLINEMKNEFITLPEQGVGHSLSRYRWPRRGGAGHGGLLRGGQSRPPCSGPFPHSRGPCICWPGVPSSSCTRVPSICQPGDASASGLFMRCSEVTARLAGNVSCPAHPETHHSPSREGPAHTRARHSLCPPAFPRLGTCQHVSAAGRVHRTSNWLPLHSLVHVQ